MVKEVGTRKVSDFQLRLTMAFIILGFIILFPLLVIVFIISIFIESKPGGYFI